MNWNDLKASVAEEAGISEDDVGSAMSAVLASISDALTKGDKVVLTTFGSS